MPRGPERAADQAPDTHVNGKVAEPAPPTTNGAEPEPVVADPAPVAEAETTLLPVLAGEAELAALPNGPALKGDPGLYAVLGLDPSASDAIVQTTYRRKAARLMGGSGDSQALKQLNVAYEVLGNPARRTEYDRMRLTRMLSPGPPSPIRNGPKVNPRSTRRRRPRHAVQPRYAGLGDVLVVLTVVGLAVVAGVLLIPRLSINLSALNAVQAVLPLQNSTRRVLDAPATAAPTAEPTATPLPSVSSRYAASTVGVSNPTPAQNTSENVQIRLRRDGQPVPNSDVWATVSYRTTEERWPPTGTVKTDAQGAATITFNIGAATPNYPVQVHVFTRAEDQQLSWSTSFTPH